MIAYKFVDWEVDPLNNLKDSFPYKMRMKFLNGVKLTRDEKNQLYREIQNTGVSKMGIPLLGWLFNYSDWLHTYYVETKYNEIYKVYALDKTSIRAHEPYIRKITEIQ